MRTVTAVYQRDAQGVWTVQLAEEPRCHTWGRSYTAAHEAIREAGELWLEELGVARVEELDFRDDVKVPHGAEAIAIATRRSQLESELERVRRQTDQMAAELVQGGLSVRDAAALLGLSPGRISQLVGGVARKPVGATVKKATAKQAAARKTSAGGQWVTKSAAGSRAPVRAGRGPRKAS